MVSYFGSSFLPRSLQLPLQLPSPPQVIAMSKTPDETEKKLRKRILFGDLNISVHVEQTKAHLLSDDDMTVMEDGIQGILKKARKEISELTQTQPWNTAHEQGCHITLYWKPVETQSRLDKNPH